MKILFLLSLSLNTLATTVSVTNICEESLFMQEKIHTTIGLGTVSDYTLHAFQKSSIDFKGDEIAITSILNTQTGLDAYEVISDNEMKAYGWCFEVDGKQPNLFMNQIKIDPTQNSHINWFYGYAHYLNGEWITYCSPSNAERSAFVCKD